MSAAVKERTGIQVAAPATMPSAPASEATAIIQMIERAATNPAVDIDKLERLLQMQERIVERNAEQAFNAAMTAAQAEMRPVSADAVNPQTRSKYASYAQLDRALRPIYTKHGFSLSFDEADSPKPEHVRVVCYVSHTSGHSRTYHRDMPADGKGAKGGDVMTKTHAAGAAGSYGARYLLKGIFNVAIGEHDDDGNSAGGYARINQDQADTIRDLLESTGRDKARFLKWAKIERIEDLRADFYESAINAIKAPAKS